MKKSKIYPPTFFNTALVIMIILHFLMPIREIIAGYWKLIGIIPLLIGVSFNLIADKDLKSNNTTVKPDEESNVLITHGVFKISRNPMYIGMVLIQIGIALFLGTVSPYLIIVIFIFVMDKKFIRTEEVMLREKFGMVWNRYKESTRRWI